MLLTTLKKILLAGLLLFFLAACSTGQAEHALPTSPAVEKPTVSAASEGWDVAQLLEAKGHAIQKHVSKDDAYLRQRLEEEKISAASSFSDMDTAVEAIRAALQSDQEGIAAWLASDSQDRYVLSYRHNRPVGVTLKRGASRAVEASKVRVVLEKDPSQPNGFYILTAYPE